MLQQGRRASGMCRKYASRCHWGMNVGHHTWHGTTCPINQQYDCPHRKLWNYIGLPLIHIHECHQRNIKSYHRAMYMRSVGIQPACFQFQLAHQEC